MKRLTALMVISGIALCCAFSARSQVKQKGWWVMDRAEVVQKPTNPDFKISGTSLTYRNKKTWDYTDNRKGGDNKKHVVSDEIVIAVKWGAPPPQIKAGAEGALDMSYSFDASPERYKDKEFRRMRGTPGFGLDIRAELVRKNKNGDPFNAEWQYSAPAPVWGFKSGEISLFAPPPGYLFTGVDVSDGTYELVLSICADFSGLSFGEAQNYVIRHYYHFEPEKKAPSTKTLLAPKAKQEEDDGFGSLEDIPANEQLEYLQSLLERTRADLKKEQAKGAKANQKTVKELQESIATLKREIAKIK